MTAHVGIVGGGNISATHARVAAAVPGVKVVAVFGRNRDKVAALAAEHGAAAYDDFGRFLAHRPMEIVCIGSPSGLHGEQGIAAARAGLHVMVEKPIETTTERADALIDAAEAAGVKLGVFYQDRFQPDLARLKQWLDGGNLGRVHFVDARLRWWRPPEYYANSRWRGTWALDGGGAVINQGSHTIDLLVWLFGDVSAVRAITCTAVHEIETEDTAAAILEFESGAIGVYQAATSVYPGYPRRVEIAGANGSIIVEQNRVIAADLRSGGYPGLGSADVDTNPSTSSPLVSDSRGHQSALEDFLEAIRENRAPRCDGREARRSVAVIEAIYRASRNGQRVTF
jgi:UDP-N-acetyl-2-amino-2-deoxyglucuronate dehydrogenase